MESKLRASDSAEFFDEADFHEPMDHEKWKHLREVNHQKLTELDLSSGSISIPFAGFQPAAAQPAQLAEQKHSDDVVLNDFRQYLNIQTAFHFGYPYNLAFNHEEIFDFLKFSINNLGDPFVESNYAVHSRPFELAVLDFFAKLWKIEAPNYWGYVTTCGTEGNLEGILLAREALPEGILYASKESHYSVFKSARFYRMEAYPINTLPNGEIDCNHLESQIAAHLDKPVIINVNIGTTVKGAVDDLDRILRILESLDIPEDRFYIHCDGALMALMLPFIKFGVEVSFKKPIGSIAVSGHKFLGCPLPCGVILTRKCHADRLSQSIEYINSKDTTIMGSRNGQAPLFMWYTLRKRGCEGLAKNVKACFKTARYLRDLLRKNGISCMLNDMSSTVVFERPPSETFVKKWQLACQGDLAHVVVMPNVTVEKIDFFIEELLKCRAENQVKQPCLKANIGSFCTCADCKKPAQSIGIGSVSGE